MPNARAKGLGFCREVKKILEAMGHEVEGPGYATAFFQGATHAIHRDYFGIWDLISFYENVYYFHQVSTIENKSTKIKSIQGKKMLGFVWIRSKKNKYKIFKINLLVEEINGHSYFLRRSK